MLELPQTGPKALIVARSNVAGRGDSVDVSSIVGVIVDIETFVSVFSLRVLEDLLYSMECSMFACCCMTQTVSQEVLPP